MKLQYFAFALLTLVAVCTLGWIALRGHQPQRTKPQQTTPQQIQTTGFLGCTNGVALSPMASAFVTHHPKTSLLQQWHAAGACAGLFTITNAESLQIRLYCLGSFQTEGPQLLDEGIMLLNASNITFDLHPGQSVTVQVPVLPHQGRWRAMLLYERIHGVDPLFSRIRAVPAALLARMRGSPMGPTREKFHVYSDWISE